MSNNDEYTPDFEVPSENDTSQVVSVQSEILDEAESSVAKSVDESPPFSSTSPKRPKTQESSPEEDEETPKHQSKELDEIEDIIRKLERLEKAQNLLEDALHLSDAEPDLPDISEKSERTERSYPTSRSSYRSEKVSQKSRSKTSVSEDNSVDIENDVELSQAIQTGMDSIRQIIEQDLNSQKKKSRENSLSSVSKSSRKSSRFPKGPKIIDGSGDHSEKAKPVVEAENVRLKNELARQEALIAAYQKENEKLYGQLKTVQDELQGKEASHDSEVKDLKTEITTLKMNRLVSLPTPSGTNSPRLGSAHKGELDRLNEELTVKSLMIVELRKEIALLKVEKESRPASARLKPKTPPLSIDKEKEYQDRIKALQKQVRTLQRILYNKESATASTSTTNLNRAGASSARSSLASRGRAMSLGKFDVSKKAVSTPNIDTAAIQKLEAQLEKERTEFQRRLSEKQKIIADNEVQIKTLKVELSKVPKDQPDGASETESAILEQLQNRLLNQSEIIQTLKEQLSSVKAIESERDAFKREVSLYESRVKELQRKLTRAETMAKPSFRGGSTKEVQKPTMNQEKEKEYQKQIQNMQKQVRTLQKILYNKNPGGAAPAPNRSMGTSESKEDLRANVTSTRPKSLGPFKRPAVPAPAKSNFNTQMLECTFEQERMEFEKLLTQRQIQIEEKDRQIRELKSKLSATIEENAWIAHESTTEKATHEEFRANLSAQKKIIESLKSRLASYANVEAERTMLKREIHHLEFRVQDLQRKLARAESLARPEGEVLATLSEKVEDLHTRYYYRERQLDTLLDRLSLKTGQSFGSPRSLHSYNANPCSINGNSTEFLPGPGPTSSTRSNNIDLGELSPSATLHLIPHRDVPEI